MPEQNRYAEGQDPKNPKIPRQSATVYMYASLLNAQSCWKNRNKLQREKNDTNNYISNNISRNNKTKNKNEKK